MTLLRNGRQRSLVGVIAAMAVVNLVYGITFPLLALVLDSQGVSKSLIGLSTIMQAVSVIVIAPFAPALMSRYSPARLMQAMTVVLAFIGILNTLLMQVHSRGRELSILITLGIDRGQLFRLLLVEGLVIGMVGAVLAGFALVQDKPLK